MRHRKLRLPAQPQHLHQQRQNEVAPQFLETLSRRMPGPVRAPRKLTDVKSSMLSSRTHVSGKY